MLQRLNQLSPTRWFSSLEWLQSLAASLFLKPQGEKPQY